MLLLSIAALAVMGLCNYLLCRKLLYPPTVLCSVWAADLIIIWMSGDFFYRLSISTLVIFVGGAFCFSIGSAVCLGLNAHPRRTESKAKQSLIWLIIIGSALSLPFLYRWIAAGSSGYDTRASFFLIARRFMLETQEDGGGFEFATFSNLAAISIVIAIIAFAEIKHSRFRAIVAILISSALNILIGARAGLIILLLCCVCIHWLREGRFGARSIAIASMALVFIMGVMAVVLGKSSSDNQESLADTVSAVEEQFYLYSAGGLIGFDQVVRHPNIVPHNWQIDRFPLQVARAMGSRTEVPPIHAEFTAVGPNFLVGNVYTMYFAYVDLGMVGMMSVLLLLGVVSCAAFTRALAGNPIASMLYAMIFSGICLSVFSEYFFMGIPFLLRTCGICWFIYSAPRLLQALRQNLVRITDAMVHEFDRA